MMIEVFRTNVQDRNVAQQLLQELLRLYPYCRITFDLDDHDRVLRIAGTPVNPATVIRTLRGRGYHCEVLDY